MSKFILAEMKKNVIIFQNQKQYSGIDESWSILPLKHWKYVFPLWECCILHTLLALHTFFLSLHINKTIINLNCHLLSRKHFHKQSYSAGSFQLLRHTVYENIKYALNALNNIAKANFFFLVRILINPVLLSDYAKYYAFLIQI